MNQRQFEKTFCNHSRPRQKQESYGHVMADAAAIFITQAVQNYTAAWDNGTIKRLDGDQEWAETALDLCWAWEKNNRLNREGHLVLQSAHYLGKDLTWNKDTIPVFMYHIYPSIFMTRTALEFFSKKRYTGLTSLSLDMLEKRHRAPMH